MIQLAFLIRNLSIGGTENQLLELVRALPKNRFQIGIFSFYESGDLVSQFRMVPGVRVIFLGKRHRWDLIGFFLRLVSELREFKPDVLYAQLEVSNLLAVILRPFLNRRTTIILGLRSANQNVSNIGLAYRIAITLEALLSRFAHLTIANSEAGARYAEQRGFIASRVRIVPNGVDTEKFTVSAAARQRMRKELGIAENISLIGIVARLDPIKNHELFLRSAALFSQRDPESRFICVGGGWPERQKSLRKLAQELTIQDRLIWIDSAQDIPAVYNALDICTLCSDVEGLPNALLEAMACGVPCAATPVGDCSVILGETGACIEGFTPEDVCAAWSKILSQHSESTRVACRERILNQFTLEKLAQNISGLIEEYLPQQSHLHATRGVQNT